MDPKDIEIAELKKKVDSLTGEVQTLTEKVTLSQEQIKEKDRVINEKNADLVGLRNQNRRIKELSEEEKAQLSDEQIKSHEQLLLLQQQMDEKDKEIQTYKSLEIESRRDSIIKRLANGDATLAEKIKFNFDRVKGSEEAHTEQDIEKIATDARNMLGTIAPAAPLAFDNNGGDGITGDDNKENSFADTEQGKALSDVLGI
jgi:DNA repair exonuclease SbcCD ATPase subunit